MKHYPIFAILFLVFASVAQAAENYTINPANTMPNFEVKHLGFSTLSGRFNKTSGNVILDFKAKSGSVDLTIFTDSLDMGQTNLSSLEIRLSDQRVSSRWWELQNQSFW